MTSGRLPALHRRREHWLAIDAGRAPTRRSMRWSRPIRTISPATTARISSGRTAPACRSSDGRTGKTFEQLLDDPDIKDQFAYPYPLGADVKAPA